MQSPTERLPLVVASTAARTVVEGQKDSKGSTSGESDFFSLQKGKVGGDDCGDLLSGPHSYPLASS